jgi:phosphohistidine phosphatase
MPHLLYLVRHAHAEEGSAYLPDHDRELLSHGIMAAARTGRYLREQTPGGIGIIVSSTAFRATGTAKVLAEQTGLDPDAALLDAALFDQGPKAYLAVVNALPEAATVAVLVGHNPDISYFAEYLTHDAIGPMGKGDVVAIELSEGLPWATASGRSGRLIAQWSPNQ